MVYPEYDRTIKNDGVLLFILGWKDIQEILLSNKTRL